MRKLLTGVVALSAGALGAGQASACSCMGVDNAGFVHSNAKRLPSNAKGALFLRPRGTFRYLGQHSLDAVIIAGELERLSPSSFRITSDQHGGSVPAVLSYPDSTRGDDTPDPIRYLRFVRPDDERRAGTLNHEKIADLLKTGQLNDVTHATREAMRLVRVGPVGGFKPGAAYKIAYVGKADRWRFPALVEHAIDTTPLDTKAAIYRLEADGPPVAMLLPLQTSSGSCSSSQAALVQNFRYVFPAAHGAYEAAMIFASESKPLTAPAGQVDQYQPMVYKPSLCPDEPFMSTAFAAGRDIVHAQCATRPGPVTVRGWAGMLEVEDRLHPTDTLRVDLSQAAGGSCTGFGLLASALASGDPARIKQTACALEEEHSIANVAFAEPLAGFPTRALFDQFAVRDPELQTCARNAAIRLFNETSLLGGKNLAAYAALVRDDLASTDPERVAMGAAGLSSLAMNLRRTRDAPPPGASAEELLTAVLDSMVHALIANRAPETAELASLFARVRQQAMPHVPSLLAAAASDAGGAMNAMSALEVLIADDPRLHRLLANARRPHLRAHAALVYSRVAGKAQPDVAIGLLIDAGREGNREAIEALETFGRRGRAAVPMLMQQLGTTSDPAMRVAILSALIALSDGDPAALRAVGAALNAPGADKLPYYRFKGLASIGKDGRVLLPAFEERMRKPMPMHLKKTLVQSIATMGLPVGTRDDLLARLEKVPLAAED